MRLKKIETSIAAPFGATDLRVTTLRWDTRQLRWAELEVLPTEQALWRRLDDSLGALRWRMMFSMLEGQALCSLSHVDEGSVITRQGYAPRTDNVGASFFHAALRASQMFGVAAELQGLPRITVGLRQTDLVGRTVKDCFHVSCVDYDGAEIGVLEIVDQYRRRRWPKSEENEGDAPDTKVPATAKEVEKKAAPPKEKADEIEMIRHIGACSTQEALMKLFEEQPQMVNRPSVFAAIRSRMNIVTRNAYQTKNKTYLSK